LASDPGSGIRDPGSEKFPADPVPRIGVLISGRGSNLQALIDAVGAGALDAHLAVVISNNANAAGLDRARAAGIEALVLDHRGFASRDGYDCAVTSELRAREVSLVCLAGFMRLVGRPLLDAFPHAILNVHPSLLPAFPGVDAQRRALEHGVKITGATVHLVTGELDGGPIVAQSPVPVLDGDTPDTLSARILIEEHRIYPEAVRTILNGGWRVDGRRFIPAAP
jgi:phosphoribosylglycinamide formyltransferase-1